MPVKTDKTTEKRKEDLEKTKAIVEKFLSDLAGYYDVLGFDGLITLVNPSLKDLLKVIKNFENKAEEFLNDAISSEKEDFFEINEIINLKQGLLFARGLIVSAIDRNKENCDKYRDDLE